MIRCIHTYRNIPIHSRYPLTCALIGKTTTLGLIEICFQRISFTIIIKNSELRVKNYNIILKCTKHYVCNLSFDDEAFLQKLNRRLFNITLKMTWLTDDAI